MTVVTELLQHYGHVPILFVVVALLLGARVHIRIERNGSGKPKLRFNMWFEGRSSDE